MCCVCPPLAASRSNSPMIKKRSQQRCEETPSSTDTASHDYWSIAASLNRLHPPITHGQSNLYSQVQRYFIKLTMSLCSVLMLFLLLPPSSTNPPFTISCLPPFTISYLAPFTISYLAPFTISCLPPFTISYLAHFSISYSLLVNFCLNVSSPYWCITLQLNIVTIHDIVTGVISVSFA